MADLSRVSCAYCNRRAHTTEWEGDAEVPVCKDHAAIHAGVTTMKDRPIGPRDAQEQDR